jgi:2-dehydropantoate 2-reductase
MFRELLGDTVAVAGAAGVDVSDDLVDRWLEFATDLDADSYSSLHYDMTHGKRMELETFHGTVVRLADDHDLPVSMSRAVYSILRSRAVRNDTE